MAKKYEAYTESRKRFKEMYGKRLQGYVLWETYMDNFKLECWMTMDEALNPTQSQPTIFQIFPNGAGFMVYTVEH